MDHHPQPSNAREGGESSRNRSSQESERHATDQVRRQLLEEQGQWDSTSEQRLHEPHIHQLHRTNQPVEDEPTSHQSMRRSFRAGASRVMDRLRRGTRGGNERGTIDRLQTRQEWAQQARNENTLNNLNELYRERSLPTDQASEMRERFVNWKEQLNEDEEEITNRQRNVPEASLKFAQLDAQISSIKGMKSRIDHIATYLTPDNEQSPLHLNSPDLSSMQQEGTLLEMEKRHLKRCQTLQNKEDGGRTFSIDELNSLDADRDHLRGEVVKLQLDRDYLRGLRNEPSLSSQEQQMLDQEAGRIDLRLKSTNLIIERMDLLHQQLDPISALPSEQHWQIQKQKSDEQLNVLRDSAQTFNSIAQQRREQGLQRWQDPGPSMSDLDTGRLFRIAE